MVQIFALLRTSSWSPSSIHLLRTVEHCLELPCRTSRTRFPTRLSQNIVFQSPRITCQTRGFSSLLMGIALALQLREWGGFPYRPVSRRHAARSETGALASARYSESLAECRKSRAAQLPPPSRGIARRGCKCLNLCHENILSIVYQRFYECFLLMVFASCILHSKPFP